VCCVNNATCFFFHKVQHVYFENIGFVLLGKIAWDISWNLELKKSDILPIMIYHANMIKLNCALMKPHKNELLKNLDDLNKGSYQSKHGWQIMISFKFNNWNFVYKPIWSKPLFIDE
jgi:hypothetical protein